MAHAHTYTQAHTHSLSHARMNSGFEKVFVILRDKNTVSDLVFFVLTWQRRRIREENTQIDEYGVINFNQADRDKKRVRTHRLYREIEKSWGLRAREREGGREGERESARETERARGSAHGREMAQKSGREDRQRRGGRRTNILMKPAFPISIGVIPISR